MSKISRRELLKAGGLGLLTYSGLCTTDLREDIVNALKVNINEHTITNNLIPQEFHEGCVIHLTDIHIGEGAKGVYNIGEWLQKEFTNVIKIIDSQGIPREKVIVCNTGDIANSPHTGYPSSLSDIQDNVYGFDIFPTKNRLFVPGNHDIKTFPDEINTIFSDMGYIHCDSGLQETGLPFNIIGTPEYTTQSRMINSEFIQHINKNSSKELFTILMTHNPDGMPILYHPISGIKINNSVTLSGHTHGLQTHYSGLNIAPHIMQYIAMRELKLEHGKTKYLVGKYHDSENNRTFINTNGIGDHTTAMRTAPHEISLIHLKKY